MITITTIFTRISYLITIINKLVNLTINTNKYNIKGHSIKNFTQGVGKSFCSDFPTPYINYSFVFLQSRTLRLRRSSLTVEKHSLPPIITYVNNQKLIKEKTI